MVVGIAAEIDHAATATVVVFATVAAVATAAAVVAAAAVAGQADAGQAVGFGEGAAAVN